MSDIQKEVQMNKHNVPWIREWEGLDLGFDRSKDIVTSFLAVLLFVALAMLAGYLFAEGMVAEAEVAQAKAEGARLGRLELLQYVQQEQEKEGKVWTAFYRAASKPGMSGFDGVMLVER